MSLPSPVAVTRSREAGASRTGSIVITNGADSFYQSRAAFQTLYDFGGFASIRASTADVLEAKKSLLSRTARYSGLVDALDLHDAADGLATAFEGCSTWLALHADEAKLGAQIEAAAAAGVSRAFILFSADGPTVFPSDGAALEARLASAGISYTIMRTGSMRGDAGTSSVGGVGLVLGELDVPVCEDVPQEDVYRVLTEALSLSEADGLAFSLCPSDETLPRLKELRRCGYERRDEVRLLLTGALTELPAAADSGASSAEETAFEAQVAASEAGLSEAEVASKREEELKLLLQKARQKGAETQAKLKWEADEKARVRDEWKNRKGGGDDVASLEASLAAAAAEKEAAAKAEKEATDKNDGKD